jgi:hypothetical protein
MPVNNLIQLRRGTAAQWTTANPTLSAGEVGFETDTGKFKIGTGSTAWTALVYAVVIPEVEELGTGDIDGGDAVSWYTWLDLKVDNSDANEKIADGSYVDGGSAVI